MIFTIFIHFSLWLTLISGLDYQCSNGPYEPCLVAENATLIGLRDPIFPRVRQFLGIPFASPPVGNQRWKPPKPLGLKELQGVRRVQSFSAACPQLEFFLNQSEDCLYLNVFTPEVRSERLLPVLVFIYGGAFIMGHGSEHKIYDGSFIVQNHDVVIVTINYRLGALGFLALNEEIVGNYGIMDQQLALHWVKNNIHYFNGNPDQVTLWGQSAGAMSVAIHLTMESSRSLFHRAILQSPPLGFRLRTKEQAQLLGRKLVKVLKCHRSVNQSSCLRSKAAASITALRTPINIPGKRSKHSPNLVGHALTWFPHVDGQLITENTFDAMLSNRGSMFDIPILLGTNRDEASILEWILQASPFFRHSLDAGYFNGLQRPWSGQIYKSMVRYIFHEHAPTVLERFPPIDNTQRGDMVFQAGDEVPHNKLFQSNAEQFWHMMTDFVFQCPIQNIIHRLSTSSKNLTLFHYSFDFVPEYLNHIGGFCAAKRVCHAVELPYVFHSGTQLIHFTPREMVLSERLIQFWIDFATRPQLTQLVSRVIHKTLEWPVFATHSPLLNMSRATMIINDDWRVQSDHHRSDCDFWHAIGYNF